MRQRERAAAYGLDVERRLAPFEAGAILASIGLFYPWGEPNAVALAVAVVLVLISIALLAAALRDWPRPLQVALGTGGIVLVLWPWAGPQQAEHAAVAGAAVLIIGAAHYLSWERLTSRNLAALSIASALCVGLLAYRALWPPALVFPVLLLPVLWAALSNNRRELAVILGICLCIQLGVTHGQRENLIQAPSFGGLLLLVGVSVHLLNEQFKRHLAHSDAIAEVLRSLVEGRDSAGIRHSLCEILAELLKASAVTLFEFNPQSQMLVPTAGVPRLPQFELSLEGDVIGPDGTSYGQPEPPTAMWEAFRTGHPVLRQDVSRLQRPLPLQEAQEKLGIRGVLCQPILREGSVVAVMAVMWPREMKRLSSDQASLVAQLADEAGLLLVQADLRARVEALARTDALTGASNRQHWDEELRRSLERAGRTGRPVCAAILDFDHFKAVNDDLGHQAGDALLQRTARSWRQGLRSLDLLGRYGGDEFCVLLPDCDLEEAMEVLERLRVLGGVQAPFSAGLARWDGSEAGSELLVRADAALYEAKRSGGDCTLTAPERSNPQQALLIGIRRVLGGGPIDMALQPIERLADGKTIGHEVLARFPGLAETSVESVFVAARRSGMARELDRLCRTVALQRAQPSEGILFVNTSVWAVLDEQSPKDLAELSAGAGLRPEQIVLELSERDLLSDLRIVDAVKRHRACGFRFALDDLGTGHSSLQVLGSIDASYLKLAAPLVTSRSPRSEAIIAAVIEFARRTDAQVIAEGIETDGHLERARELGVELGQGYKLGLPRLRRELVGEPN